MGYVSYSERALNFKIVYYGPGLCGKTTNLQYVHSKTAPSQRGQLISLATETERVLFFDFTPRSFPPIGGLKLRFHLYTIPGPVFYDGSRKLILKGVDGIVFVCDSQRERGDADVESLENLESNLATHGHELRNIPTAVQYNKRDLPSAMPVGELDELTDGLVGPRFEAIATTGQGVFDTLKAVMNEIVEQHRAKLGESPSGQK